VHVAVFRSHLFLHHLFGFTPFRLWGGLWVWIQVPVVTAFYLAMVSAGVNSGWDAAQAFAGMAIAVAVLLLCNSIVRPAGDRARGSGPWVGSSRRAERLMGRDYGGGAWRLAGGLIEFVV